MAVSFPVTFSKMSGAGNDFLLIDNRDNVVNQQDKQNLVKKVCRRRFGVGGDGLIFIESSSSGHDFRWDFYNSDGSVAEMCGNGARCVARYAFLKGIAGKKQTFETLAGVIEAEICDNREVRIKMTAPFGLKRGEPVLLGGQERTVLFINTGVPHAVIFTEDERVPVHEWGPAVRFHRQFQPEGTNVNFVTAGKDGFLHVRTYERGVEEETQACGTGAVAAAITGVKEGVTVSPVTVVTTGGAKLKILFDLHGDGSISDVFMQGEAHLVYTGELLEESMF